MLALSLLVTSQSHIFISFFKVSFSHIFHEYEEENLPIAHLYLIFKGLFSSHFQEYEEEKPYGNTDFFRDLHDFQEHEETRAAKNLW